MSGKRYTAQEMREMADAFEEMVNPLAVCIFSDGKWHTIYAESDVVAMLRQAADMVERCEKLRFNMIPHKHDTEIVDYIRRGYTGKEKQ